MVQEETQWELGASFAKSVHAPPLAPVSGADLFQQIMIRSVWDSLLSVPS